MRCVRSFAKTRSTSTQLGAVIRALAPRAVVTCARGSSDHAATYAKYLIETRARVLTASAAPSVSSVYGIEQDLRGCLFIAISQSGAQPGSARLRRRRQKGRRDDPRPVQSPRCAAHGGRRSRDPLARRPRGQRCGNEVVSRHSRRARAPGCGVDAERSNARRARGASRSAGSRVATRLDSRAAPASDRGASLRRRPRPGPRRGPGNRAEMQGNLRTARGEFQQRGAAPRSVHATRATISGAAARPERCHPRRACRSRRGARESGHAACFSRARRRGARRHCPRSSARPEIGPIVLVQSAYRLLASLALRRGFDPDRPASLSKVTETV